MIHKATDDLSVRRLLQVALDHNLYVQGWQAQPLFDDILKFQERNKRATGLIDVAMYYHQDAPIAWGIRWKKSGCSVFARDYYPSMAGSHWRFTKPGNTEDKESLLLYGKR